MVKPDREKPYFNKRFFLDWCQKLGVNGTAPNGRRANPYVANANGLTDLEGRGTPRHEHNALMGLTSLLLDDSGRNSLQNSSREGLPALFRVRVCFVGSNGQASVQPQHTLLSDLSEIAEENVSRSTTLAKGRHETSP